MPALSIVIPNLDSPWLAGTLAGLAAQGIPDDAREVIVVGSDAHGLVPRDGTIRLLNFDDRPNPAAARNRGVAVARGARLLFLDADCTPLAGWAAALDRALDRAPIAGGAVSFPRSRERTNRWALADNIASFHELLADRPAEDASNRPLGSLNLAVRRETWERVGPFEEALMTSEDFDWILRARALGIATAFVPQAVVEHAAVRADRDALLRHAHWYASNFHEFRARHPRAFGTGPTWGSQARLRRAAPLKAWTGALGIFLRHPTLWLSLHALPSVIAFRRAWYDAVIAGWPPSSSESASQRSVESGD